MLHMPKVLAEPVVLALVQVSAPADQRAWAARRMQEAPGLPAPGPVAQLARLAGCRRARSILATESILPNDADGDCSSALTGQAPTSVNRRSPCR